MLKRNRLRFSTFVHPLKFGVCEITVTFSQLSEPSAQVHKTQPLPNFDPAPNHNPSHTIRVTSFNIPEYCPNDRRVQKRWIVFDPNGLV